MGRRVMFAILLVLLHRQKLFFLSEFPFRVLFKVSMTLVEGGV